MTRAILSKMVIKGCGCRTPDIDWPYYFDAAGYPNGAMPYPWIGATWAISSGKAINTPSLGGEMLADPGLEANYTAGKCDTLSKTGLPTLLQSADVHGGAKAQNFTAVANNDSLYFAGINGVSSAWYQTSLWGKRLAGAVGEVSFLAYMDGGIGIPLNIIRCPITSAAYAQKRMNVIPLNTGPNYIYPTWQLGATGYDTILVDDVSLKLITNSSLFALLPSAYADVVVKIVPDTLIDSTWFGVILKADKQINPTNYIMGLGRLNDTETFVNFMLIKCIAGAYTIVLNEVPKAEVANAWFELRASGTQVSMWYNNLQVGATQTISDAAIASNKYHGLISGGNNPIKKVFATNQLIDYPMGWAGTSITAAFAPGYRDAVQLWLQQNAVDKYFTHTQTAVGGWSSWANLVKLSTIEATNPKAVVFDAVNDMDTPIGLYAREAMIRRLYALVYKNVIAMNFFIVTDHDDNAQVNTPAYLASINDLYALAALYNFPLVDYWDYVRDRVNNHGENLNAYSADSVHPTALGYATAAALLEAAGLPNHAHSGVLPTRLHPQCADFELAPTVKFGTAFDARAGVWVDTGTSTASVTPGSTITYSGTFRSFGCVNAAGVYPDVSVVIDADPPINPLAFQCNGYDYGVRAAHTVVITVLTTCTIDEFWAI